MLISILHTSYDHTNDTSATGFVSVLERVLIGEVKGERHVPDGLQLKMLPPSYKPNASFVYFVVCGCTIRSMHVLIT